MSKSVLSRIAEAVKPTLSPADIRSRLATARTAEAQAASRYRVAAFDAERGAGTVEAKQQAFEALMAARQRIADLSAAEVIAAAEERKQAEKAAADAITADNARILKLYDVLEVTAAKLSKSADAYTKDWAAFTAALDAANEARQQCPRVPRERGTSSAEEMVVTEMTRLAFEADASMPPSGSEHLKAAGDPRRLPALTTAVKLHADVIRTDLSEEVTHN